uniref:H/ACA ribonucleoprotein complex non-core subunit NAF1 n=1 Tax=Caenorhabditis japonica TaxID=281687 RepID=A0A8R1HUN6_CAEJA
MSEEVKKEIKEEEPEDFIIDRNPVPLAFCAHPTTPTTQKAPVSLNPQNDVMNEIMEMIEPIQIENPGEIRRPESIKSFGCDTESEFEFSGGEDSDFENLRDLKAGAVDSDDEFDRLVHFSAKILAKTHRSEYPEENATRKSRKSAKSQKIPNQHEYDDLPPLENLSIECKSRLAEFGFVSKVVDCIVLIKPTCTEILDLESLIFDEKGTSIGQIYDIFGQVKCPQYAIRFNSVEEAQLLPIDMKVFYAPNEQEYSKTPFKGLNLAAANRETIQTLNRRMDHQEAVKKANDIQNNADVGSDVEFSDDEAEKEYRKTRTNTHQQSAARGGRKRDRRGAQSVRFSAQTHSNPRPYQRDFDVAQAPAPAPPKAAETPVPVKSEAPNPPPATNFDNPYAEFGCYSAYNGRFGI